jgi:Type IX secretion system membrane protein PorP/SprF
MKFLPSFLMLIACFLQINTLFAQQLPIFTQYRESHGYINPASINSDFLTSEYNMNFGSSYRQQWAGVTGSPTDILLHGEYLKKSRSNFHLLIGGTFLKDETAPISVTLEQVRIASVMADDPFYGAFSVGISAGAAQYRLDLNKVVFVQPNSFTPSPLQGLYADFAQANRSQRLF